MKVLHWNRAPRGRPRLLIGTLTLLTTAAATWVFTGDLAAQSTGLAAALMLGLFVVLSLWVSLSFWLATIGFIRRLSAGSAECGASATGQTALDSDIRVAILMPIYNEDPHSVFAGLQAIFESLQATGQSQSFDFFVLSDTTNPDLWLLEESCWARLNLTITGPSHIYYRHRAKNVGRKAGNIADFCERWGSAYRFMIVLDADSVMSGETLVEMVRRMEQDRELGILQVPPMPVNRVSLFARCQQFAARVFGPVFLEGFAWWTHVDGNYWGHNAIIRVAAFTRHCGLSSLPGEPPLGGEILSHDFVEAALMRRAGLKVCVAHDLEGSYEESPPTLIDYAQRDQRWCQGNLQHIRLVFSYGIPPMSRLHMSMGSMAYLSSPLWLIFMLMGFLSVAFSQSTADVIGAGEPAPTPWWASWPLFVATMTLLLLPKLWGYLLLLRDPARLATCGGAFKAAISVVVETIVSILVAPIMMAFHVTFVLSTLVGFRVTWNAQQRQEGGQRLRAAIAAHWWQTLAGLAATAAVWAFAPEMLPWLSPVLFSLILAIPLSMILSSVTVGQALANKGLLLTSEDTAPPAVLERYRQLKAQPVPMELKDPRALFARVLTDPAFAALHRCILLATDATLSALPQQLRRADKYLRARGAERVSAEDRKAILSDPSALGSLQLSAFHTTRLPSANPP